MDIKLSEVLRHKNKGEQWYSFLCPEEYHTWQYTKPWDYKKFKKYEVDLMGMRVGANETVSGTKNITRFTTKARLYLNNTGVEIEDGFFETKTKRIGSIYFPCDGVLEANDILHELSDLFEVRFWEIKSIKISNYKIDGVSLFKRHNPDGHGVNLFFYKHIIGKESFYYPDICFSDQEHYLGKFKQHFAVCTCDERLMKFHGCSINKKHRKPIH